MWSILAAAGGMLFAWLVFQRGHLFMAIAFLVAGCGVAPWLEYTLLRDNKAPYVRLIFYLFVAFAASAARQTGASN